jgi:hypothetical protein
MNLTQEAWAWRAFGRSLMLVTERGGSKVVLCTEKPDRLVVRNEQTGTLEPLTPEHEVARLIVAGPDLLGVCRRSLEFWAATNEATRHYHEANGTIEQFCPDPMEAACRAALAKVEGEGPA